MRPFLIICTLAVAWVALALGAMLTGTIATAAVPKGTRIPANVAIIGTAPGLLILRSDDPDYVSKLYQAGAAFVLPARRKTCLELQR
ncbi:hypothetical protein SAMN05444273_105265 [Litoreibacter ascidiaceicola]|uniref:Uncharacterized protein n=1 Tax=Litoreibacter ascidiaceicola TaxID=1486859 RepID=A0A1M5B0X4_9RHOB|nr:hypothetical protein [Litoreibacter ascidiaceicola]SHF36100.1 hypothetical protein SAMN05444273_105265 [Litoreibacter ascidiaceicola]